ncbi:His Kinase A (phospho-acceptor) domain-containing protein [Rhodoferax sp. OV413]|uniref:GAF domain-containing sensor histidine kinase n=1 Tax=Rhodoferax sp. OV413 TaxID=1855285 RepID=UPI000883622E|nr:GAF domain-containing sensor histidine kinase [Rhodoferax sp. OV413]SDO05103.1 His Kinase A (phospho-acceptor) domain-containing protein [Rhodoferax sp. OV413]
MDDSAEEISRDVALVGRIESVPTLLRVLCEITGMGFAAVARVTDGTWIACSVRDEISFGLLPGGQLDVNTTLCKEVRFSRTPVVIDQASTDSRYCDHITPRTYGIESYVSVPIVLSDGSYFGNLCAIDPRPAKVSEPRIVAMFHHFATLIAVELENARRQYLVQAALLGERAASELREQLIAILGYDLRTPISLIALNSQRLLAKAQDPAAVARIAGDIHAGVKQVSTLIDHALDFARGRLGCAIHVKPALVERMDEALFSVVTEIQTGFPGREIECQFDISRPVQVDRFRVLQLVANLLSNALVHGAPDSPVQLKATTTADSLVLQVSNQGPPIPHGSLDKVFAPFWRSGTSAQREGLGLGLHICAQIVQAHQGRLGVSSSADAGTVFTATFPQAAAGPANALLQ